MKFPIFACAWLLTATYQIYMSSAFACVAPRPGMYDRNKELVESSEYIVVAKAIKVSVPTQSQATRWPVAEFSFEAVRILKGNPPPRFFLVGMDARKVKGIPKDFNGHRNPDFWAFDGGNTIQPGDCVSYGLFEVGQTYLVFQRKQSHSRSYENIRTKDDLWLAVVDLLVKEQKKEPLKRKNTSK
jgi:hypothetical protein